MVLAGAGGSAYYYFALRVSDATYASASSDADAIIGTIKKINQNSAKWQVLHPDSSSSTVTASAKLVADQAESDKEKIAKVDEALKISTYGSTLDSSKSNDAVEGMRTLKSPMKPQRKNWLTKLNAIY